MSHKRLLLLSNSTNPGEPWLGWPEKHIRAFFGAEVRTLFFVPFAGVRLAWDDYAKLARQRFAAMGYELTSAHETKSPINAAREADALVVGGGNTFNLLAHLYRTELITVLRERALGGTPFLGWSAGSNVACPTIMTTNDMPIVEPASFTALDLIPFQINPHYTEAALPNFGGETRVDRLQEFVAANPRMPVLGLPEATALQVEGERVTLLGSKPAKLFLGGQEPKDMPPGELKVAALMGGDGSL